MRLLRRDSLDDFSLVTFHENIPDYAILSHTWGEDFEEITYRDIIKCTGKNKPGFQKLRFCAAQAAVDKLQYFWIDTCCIDKSSSAELSEAIRSMFRWYKNAAVCYAFLTDVSIHGQTFEESAWFTRGWTLQELLAPRTVKFFNREGELLGDKLELLGKLHKVTGIPTEALRGYPLMHFDVYDRISWAENRRTKRSEDRAYCLLGLCDAWIYLDYGEGEMRALYRLKEEIQRIVADQPFNDPFLRFVQNCWPQQFPKQGTTSDPEEVWCKRQKRIQWVTELLRGFLTSVLLVWLIISVFMLQYTPSFIWSASWLVGNMCLCLYGMQLLFKTKWERFVATGWAKLVGVCWIYLVSLLLVILRLLWPSGGGRIRLSGNARLSNSIL